MIATRQPGTARAALLSAVMTAGLATVAAAGDLVAARAAPQALGGVWSFVSVCGPESPLANQRNTGTLHIEHRGEGRFTGMLRNSFGLRGRFAGRLEGVRLEGIVDWGMLLGETRLWGRIGDGARRFEGNDSLGCSLAAVKE